MRELRLKEVKFTCSSSFTESEFSWFLSCVSACCSQQAVSCPRTFETQGLATSCIFMGCPLCDCLWISKFFIPRPKGKGLQREGVPWEAGTLPRRPMAWLLAPTLPASICVTLGEPSLTSAQEYLPPAQRGAGESLILDQGWANIFSKGQRANLFWFCRPCNDSILPLWWESSFLFVNKGCDCVPEKLY